MTVARTQHESGIVPAMRRRVVAGAAAGNITVTGIAVGDHLQSVINLAAAGADLADEFTVTAANTINNAGGTNTTGMTLLVEWFKKPRK